jgi:hypothetical protein
MIALISIIAEKEKNEYRVRTANEINPKNRMTGFIVVSVTLLKCSLFVRQRDFCQEKNRRDTGNLVFIISDVCAFQIYTVITLLLEMYVQRRFYIKIKFYIL